MTPLEHYEQQCEQGIISRDPQQLAVMQDLQSLHNDLIIEFKQREKFLSFFRNPHLIKGVYLWGGVGIGKTFMMDCFYQSLPFSKKMRMHFHSFMQRIHNALTQHQGKKDPLQVIADELAKETMVLCFDEFFVSDITDAMILGRLFSALFSRGVCLVATSNVAPDDLYKNGLQRRQFLPTIEMLKQKTHVVHISSTVDYRLRHLKEAGVFYTPLNENARANMEKSFAALTQGKIIKTDPVNVAGRLVKIKKQADGIIWFDFSELCHVPRSQKDYLAIAEKYHTVFVSDIPLIEAKEKDTICLFISMVDVFYDARIRLVISSAEPVEQIYSRGYMILEYTRTHSRLLEMQSIDYFTGEFNDRH